MMVICGALVHGIVAKSGLTISHAALFFASLGFNHLLAAGTYVLLRRRGEESFVEQPDDVTTGGSVPAPTGGGVGTAVKQQTVTVT